MKKTMAVISVLLLLSAFVFSALPVSAASHQATAKMEMDKPAMVAMMKEMMMSPEMKPMMMDMMKEMMMSPDMKPMMMDMMKEMMMSPDMKEMMSKMMSQHSGQQHGAEPTQQQHDSGGKH